MMGAERRRHEEDVLSRFKEKGHPRKKKKEKKTECSEE